MLRFNCIKKQLLFDRKITNCCYELKPGISCLSVLEKNLFSKTLLATGGFDYRIRFYELSKFDSLGKVNYNNGRINQIKLITNDDNIFLFVASDENKFFIWIVA